MSIVPYLRLLKLAYVANKYNLAKYLFPGSRLAVLRFIFYINPLFWLVFWRHKTPRGERLCQALEAMGPMYIKFGQILSTRMDILPPDVGKALAKLQDQVEPFSPKQAKKRIERSLRKPVSEVFACFDEAPLASASIAQVHTAKLPSGEDVVVKVLRPRIRRTIKKDLALLQVLAKLFLFCAPHAKRLHPLEVVKEIEKTIYNELDLMREAANASQLKRNFKDSDELYVPKIYWEYCSSNVMVSERVYGIPIGDVERLREAGVNFKVLAERGVEIFYTQVFRHSFFHADMHPGNIFVNVDDPENPVYVAVDFGIMGVLGASDKAYLADNMLAFFKRDYYRIARLHIDSGWVPHTTKVEEFEGAIRTVSEPIFDRPLNEISFGKTLLNLFRVAQEHKMELQPQLILLQKTLLNIEGLGRVLYPELDLWQTAKPFLERWMREQVGPKTLFKRLRQEWPQISQQLPELIHHHITQVRHQKAVANTPKKPKGRFVPGMFAGVGTLAVVAAIVVPQTVLASLVNGPGLRVVGVVVGLAIVVLACLNR